MNEEQLIEQIILHAFTDELEKVSAERGLGLDSEEIEKVAIRALNRQLGESASDALKRMRLAAEMKAKPLARSRSAQVGRGATGEIDMSPTFMTPRERQMGRNVAGATREAPAPRLQGGVLHYGY